MDAEYLQYMVIVNLLRAELQNVADFGFTDAQYRKLSALPLADLQQLVAGTTTRPIITFHIDENNLNNALRALKIRQSEQSLHLEFIQRGASAPMMYELFGLSRSGVAKLRRSLNLVVGNGRPRIPNKTTTIAIFDAWHKLSKTIPDQHQRYLRLHDRFRDIPLESLYVMMRSDQ